MLRPMCIRSSVTQSRQSGQYQIYFRLKQKDKVVGVGNGTVQVRAGVREEFDR